MNCPKCGSANVSTQAFQEQTRNVTVSKTKSKYKQKGHSLLWWLFIGWWWWIVDLMLWIVLFIPRLIVQLFKKKKYKGTSTTVSSTFNKYNYTAVHVCNDCGHCWKNKT